MRARVLVVSASMGAGHDGAARELVRRLQAAGHEAEMKDFLTAGPLHIGDLLRSSYEWQMKYMAWSYDLTYRFFYKSPGMCPPLGRVMTRLMARDLLRWADEMSAEVVVSTYPLTSVVLGELRRRGRLTIPAINFITDFGVHPFWIHHNIDLNLTVHPRPAELAESMSGRPSIATGPMVSDRFAEPQDRAATRAALGLSPEDRAVLIVSGSWGVGNVTATFRTIAASHRFVPIAVCGRDDHLRERLSHIPGGRAMGWTDDMPALMAASDVLVENAGGLTAMEALSVGLPIISFRPIAGHGKENTSEMQAVGVNRVARNKDQLLRLIDVVTADGPARRAMIAAGKAMFMADPTRYVEYAAATGPEGLNDRAALARLGGNDEADDFDLDQLAAVADHVEFDLAGQLRALLATSQTTPAAGATPRIGSAVGPLSGSGGGVTSAIPSGGAAGVASGGSSGGGGTCGGASGSASGVGSGVASGGPFEGASAVGTGVASGGPSEGASAVGTGVASGGPSEGASAVGTGEGGSLAPVVPIGGGALEPTGTDGFDDPGGSAIHKRRPRRPSVRVARLAALVAAVPLIWAGLTSGVAFATSQGAGVAHPARGSGNVAYLGVRLDQAQLGDPLIGQQLAALHATAVVDEQTAAADPGAVQRLVTLGIDVESGGAGPRAATEEHRSSSLPWRRADGDVASSHVLSQISGQPVELVVPGRRLNVFDLVACHDAGTKSVVPNHILQPTDDDRLHLTARHIYLVNGNRATDQQMETMLSQLQTELGRSSLSGAPLSSLV